jgi:nucleoside-diphosphate-sugar epimerase
MSPRLRLDIVVNNLVAWAFTSRAVRLSSDGTPWRPLVHVEDVCRAFLAALEAPRELVHGEAFNVGGTNENYQVRDVAELVAEVVPGSKVELAPDALPDARNYRVTCAKLVERLGVEPVWNVRRGVEEHYAAYREAGLTREDFEGPRYQRLKRIASLLESGRLDAGLRFVTSAAA